MAKPDFLSLLDVEVTWPTKGDKLFVAPSDSYDGGQIEPHAWSRLVHMASGYREAADKLVDAALEYYPSRVTMVYPIIFLYRHFIELQLKYVLVTYGRHFSQPANWKSHDLKKLWKSVRVMIDEIDQGTSDDATDAVEACIFEMAKADKGSFDFRYPVDQDGKPIATAFDVVDLDKLRQTMTKISHFFDGLDGLVDSLVSA